LIPFHPQELKQMVLGSRTPQGDRESIVELDTTTPAGEPVKRTLTWRRVA
jgi:hypothetical protein